MNIYERGKKMFTKKEKEILHAVQETSSRHFTLEGFLESQIPPQIENEDLYTLEEVAEIASMSIVTIRQYVRNNKLKAIKQWKNWMVSSNAIAQLLYERKHGVKLPTSEVMLAVLDGNLYEDGSFISQYQIVTAADILNNVQTDSSFEIDRYIKSMIPKSKSDTLYIEAISSIDNFFRRTGEVAYSDLNKIETPLVAFLPENKEIIEYLKFEVDKLIVETPSEALESIKKHFGEPSDIQTTLKIYKAFLEVCEQNLEDK